jgi:hypothetical protein
MSFVARVEEYRHALLDVSAMYSARAWMVEVGFTPPEVTQMLPSTIKRFFRSWQGPHSFTTERSGSKPTRDAGS